MKYVCIQLLSITVCNNSPSALPCLHKKINQWLTVSVLKWLKELLVILFLVINSHCANVLWLFIRFGYVVDRRDTFANYVSRQITSWSVSKSNDKCLIVGYIYGYSLKSRSGISTGPLYNNTSPIIGYLNIKKVSSNRKLNRL